MSDALQAWLKARGLSLSGQPPFVRGLGLNLALTPILRDDWSRRMIDEPDALEAELTAMLRAPGPPPGWLVARGGLRLLLMDRSAVADDALHLPLSPRAAATLVHTDPEEALITFVRTSHLEGWHVDLQEAHDAALAGLDRVLADATVELGEARGFVLGTLSTASPFKASLLLATGLRALVEPELGWPLHAVAPCRDFLYLFSDPDLIPLLGTTVMHEFEGSAHPVSNEVFALGDEGLEAIGSYDPA